MGGLRSLLEKAFGPDIAEAHATVEAQNTRSTAIITATQPKAVAVSEETTTSRAQPSQPIMDEYVSVSAMGKTVGFTW